MKNVKRVTGDCQVLWHTPVVPAAQEAEAGDCLSPGDWRPAWPGKKKKKKVTEVVPCLVAGREDHFVEVAFGQRVAGKSALQAREVLRAGF